MGFTGIFFIAVGLSMDAFAVAVSNGVSIKNLKLSTSIKIALFFGLFQAFMPVIGWRLGSNIVKYINRYAEYAAFLVLFCIGLKMIFEAYKGVKKEDCLNCSNIYILLLMAFITSIDAFAVGFSFSLLNISIILPVIVIGLTTFAISLAGVGIGRKVGHFFENKVEVFGGIILIVISFKVLLGF